ncbi:MAG: hypothetical protein H7A36_01490 [Chlamydiales bacterium]|nr:hypothetical protein [Chlamydiales bacterium]
MEPPLTKAGHTVQLIGRKEHDKIDAELLILAMKPKDFDTAPPFTGRLVASVLTNTPLAKLREKYPQSTCVRLMPNVGVAYGCGITYITTPELIPLFEPFGFVDTIDEKYFPAVAAFTGSGPAFILSLIDTLQEIVDELQLPELTLQLIVSTLMLLEQSGQTPQELISRIAPPGGTTEKGLAHFDDVRSALHRVFKAALPDA